MTRINDGVKSDSLDERLNYRLINEVVEDHAVGLKIERTDGFIKAVDLIAVEAALPQAMAGKVEEQRVPWLNPPHQPLETIFYVLPCWLRIIPLFYISSIQFYIKNIFQSFLSLPKSLHFI